MSATRGFGACLMSDCSRDGLEAMPFLTNLILDLNALLIISNYLPGCFISANGFNTAQIGRFGDGGINLLPCGLSPSQTSACFGPATSTGSIGARRHMRRTMIK